MAVGYYRDKDGSLKVLENMQVDLLNDISDKVLISAENATLSDGTERKLVDIGSYEEITAKKIDGKKFNYFKNSYNEIVSYRDVINFTQYTDNIMTAVYSDEDSVEKPTAFVSGTKLMNGLDYNKLMKGKTNLKDKMYAFFYCGWSIPAEYTIKRIAFINSFKLDNEELVFDAKDAWTDGTNGEYHNYASFCWNFSIAAAALEEHRVYRGRVGCIVEKNGVEETIYSRTVHIQL